MFQAPVEQEEEEAEVKEDAVTQRIEEVENRAAAKVPAPRVPALQRLPSLKKKDYGISLVLSNVPMSPKVINGSFAALFENSDVTAAFARHFQCGDVSSHALRLSPRRRGKLRDQNKQLSLDYNFFASKRSSGLRFKQSSLDSKIDDILEVSSIDSDINGRRADSTDNLELELEALRVEEDGGSDWKNKLSNGGSDTEAKKKQRKEVKVVNGVHTFCKHCGMSMDED